MSIFNLGKACIFSAVQGTVTLEGKPVSNAQVKRHANWQSEKSDETTTDDQGQFSFPPMFSKSVMKYLSGQFTSNQTMEVIYEGKTYTIWKTTKWSEEENAELGGKPLRLTCELSKEPEVKFVGRYGIDGVCSWD